MKKVLTIIMALAIAMSLAVPAFAYDGSAATTTKSWTSWWDHWKNPPPASLKQKSAFPPLPTLASITPAMSHP